MTADQAQPTILALIPAHNEAPRIQPVIAAARAFLPVLVVDDGSTDGTAQVARSAGAEVLRQEPNQGKGAALKAGFRQALAQGYAGVLTLDADGQHDPAEIPAFLRVYQQNASDLIIGSRDFSRMPFPRNLSNTLGRHMLSWAVGQSIPDNQSGYRLVSRRLIEATLASGQGGFEFEVDMVVICLKQKMRLDWVPIRTIYGEEKSHIQPLKHIVRYFNMVAYARKEMKSK